MCQPLKVVIVLHAFIPYEAAQQRGAPARNRTLQPCLWLPWELPWIVGMSGRAVTRAKGPPTHCPTTTCPGAPAACCQHNSAARPPT